MENPKKSLLFACSKGDHPYVEQYVQSHPSFQQYEIFDNHKWGPLHHAVASNSLECVRALLSVHKINLRSRSFEGITPFLLAIRKSPSIEIVKMLIDADPELINIPNNENEYPMHYAARAGYYDAIVVMVESLRRKNLPIKDHIDRDMETSLMLAARRRDFRIISYLLENTECDCKRLSDKNVNAFTITAMYKIPDNMKEETMQILEKLLPLSYDLGPNPHWPEFCPKLLLPIMLSWSFKNYVVVDWFVKKFYLLETNRERPLVQRLLNQFKHSPTDYSFYNILFAFHSNVTNVVLNVKSCIQKLQWAEIYIHFFEMFLSNYDLYREISSAFLPKFKEIPPDIVIEMVSNFLYGCVKIYPDGDAVYKIRGVTNYQYDRARCLEFLDQFQLHTKVDVEKIILSHCIREFYCKLPETAKPIYLNELFALLMPYNVYSTYDRLMERFINSLDIRLDRTTSKIKENLALKNTTPRTLFDLCRHRVRIILFEGDGTLSLAIRPSCEQQLRNLMSLEIPMKMRNLLRYNESNYLCK